MFNLFALNISICYVDSGMSTFGAKLKGLRTMVTKIKHTMAAAAAAAARDVPHPAEDKLFRSSSNAARNAI
jgi:hypothetical protein